MVTVVQVMFWGMSLGCLADPQILCTVNRKRVIFKKLFGESADPDQTVEAAADEGAPASTADDGLRDASPEDRALPSTLPEFAAFLRQTISVAQTAQAMVESRLTAETTPVIVRSRTLCSAAKDIEGLDSVECLDELANLDTGQRILHGSINYRRNQYSRTATPDGLARVIAACKSLQRIVNRQLASQGLQ